jgi:hypothetical protein
MATRSRIGLMLEDGTIKHSYCHWDGYPTGVGKTLLEHYSNIEKVKELLSFGDMSYLAPKINPDGIHNFENPEKDVTLFYNRDRGEMNDVDSVTTSTDEYLSSKYSSGIDYLYLLKDGNWFLRNTYENVGWELIKKYISVYALTEEENTCNI